MNNEFDIKEWEKEQLIGKYEELSVQYDGLERLLQECEKTKETIVEQKIECWNKLQSIKKVLREKYGVYGV